MKLIFYGILGLLLAIAGFLANLYAPPANIARDLD